MTVYDDSPDSKVTKSLILKRNAPTNDTLKGNGAIGDSLKSGRKGRWIAPRRCGISYRGAFILTLILIA